MTKFKKYHLPCPMCGSKDAYAIDHDGVGYCFSCGKTNKDSSSHNNNFEMEIKTRPLEEMDNKTKKLRPVELGVYKDIPERGILKSTAELYKYQVSADGKKHIANITDTSQKIRFVDNKQFLYINKPNKEHLYGSFAFKQNKDTVLVITEGELDAMSVHQITGLPAVSITHGTKSALKCIEGNIDYIKGFKGVIINFDADDAGLSAASEAHELLKKHSIPFGELKLPGGVKDSNEALLRGLEIELSEAFSAAVETVSVYEEATQLTEEPKVNNNIYFVSKTNRFHLMNKRGELCSLDRVGIKDYLSDTHRDADRSQISAIVRAITNINSDTFCEDITLMPYKPFGRIHVNGKPVLNVSQYRVIDPVPGKAETLLRLFKDMFEGEQYDYFMSWLAYFYQNCRHYNLKPSSALYLAGDQGAGKGLFHDLILKKLVGQGADGHMLFSSGFTGKIYEHPFVTFPDTFAELSDRERTKFTGLIKNIVANGNRMVNHKYGGQENIEWKGRVIVSLNLDEKSAEALPDVHKNDADKFMLLKVKKGDTITNYTYDEWDLVVNNEVAELAHILLNYQIPQELSDPRFGVKAYHNPELIMEIRSQNRNVALAEMIQKYLADSKQDEVTATSDKWLEIVNYIEDLKPDYLRVSNERMRIHTFRRKLNELCNNYSWITKTRPKNIAHYTIKVTDEDLYV